MRHAILILVLAAYGFLNLVLPKIAGGYVTYIVTSLCWLLLALITLRISMYGKVRLWLLDKALIAMSATIAVFQIVVLIFAGVFTSFGKSPYLFTPYALAINITYFSSILLGVELSRAYLIRTSGRRKTTLAIGLTAVLYASISIPLGKFISLNEPTELAKFFGSVYLPSLAENLLASYLALLGGPIPAVAYRGTLEAFEWLSPILPNPTWGIKALVGVMAPTIGFVAIERFTTPTTLSRLGLLAKARRLRKITKAKGSSPVGWMTVSMLCVLMVWTSTGLLGFYPTVIISGSMRPTMDVGDVAFIIQTPADNLKPGDIVQYWRESEMIVHRIYDTYQTASYRLFITKGDANQGPDREPVLPSQIQGKLIFIIPKIGWISIYVKTAIAGIWSFFSANTLLAYVTLTITAFMASIYMIHAYKSRSTGRRTSLDRRKGWPRR